MRLVAAAYVLHTIAHGVAVDNVIMNKQRHMEPFAGSSNRYDSITSRTTVSFISKQGNTWAKSFTALQNQSATVGLNMAEGGEIAQRLDGLYTYIHGCCLDANTYRDPARLDEALRLLGTLRSAWAEIAGAPQTAA